MAKVISKSKVKKKWFPIVSPKIFNEKVIGETHLYESGSAIGRFVQVNLMNLTNDMKNQSINVKFQIVGSQEGRLTTKITAYNIIPASVKRIVRRKQNRIDDSFTVKTADGVLLRIKPMILTRGKTSIPVVKDIRKKVKEELTKMISTSNYDNVFSNIVYKKTQKAIRDKISKIHPVRASEIRVIQKEDKMIVGEPTENVEVVPVETESKVEVVEEKESTEESKETEKVEEKTKKMQETDVSAPKNDKVISPEPVKEKKSSKKEKTEKTPKEE